jgi:hypothetical protein
MAYRNRIWVDGVIVVSAQIKRIPPSYSEGSKETVLVVNPCHLGLQGQHLSDCQACSANKLRFHFNASLSAVSFAKLEARQPTDQPGAPFSMASLKRRYCNQHLIDRILGHLADEGRLVAAEGRLDKSSPTYAELCNYGTMDDLAASILSEVLLQRNFTQLTELGDPSLPMRGIRRLVPLLPVRDQLERHLSIKLRLGEDPEQQHLHR